MCSITEAAFQVEMKEAWGEVGENLDDYNSTWTRESLRTPSATANIASLRCWPCHRCLSFFKGCLSVQPRDEPQSWCLSIFAIWAC